MNIREREAQAVAAAAHTIAGGAGAVKRFARRWALPLSILTGIIGYFVYVNIPWLDSTHEAAGKAIAVIQPALIFTMLFLTFLSIGPHDLHLRRWHFPVIATQLLMFGLMAAALIIFPDTGHRVVIECAMLCFLCPTATAAAVVTRKLGGNAADITTYTIMINLAIAIAGPLLLPLAHPHDGLTFLPTFLMILAKVFPMLIMPLIVAWCFRRWLPEVTAKLRSNPDMPFYLWIVALSLAIAVTVKAIVHSDVSLMTQVAIAAVTAVCCLFQFVVGKKLGGRNGEGTEGGQAFGQKNTVFVIWMGYTFLSPVTAVAGGFYSVWHNIFNSWQLYRHEKALAEGKEGQEADPEANP